MEQVKELMEVFKVDEQSAAFLKGMAEASQMTIDEYVESQINALPAAAVEDFRKNHPDATDAAVVANFYVSEVNKDDQKENKELTTKSTKTKVTQDQLMAQVSPALGDPEAEAVEASINDSIEARYNTTLNSHIAGFFVRAPKASDMYNGLKLEVNNVDEFLKQLEGYKEDLAPDTNDFPNAANYAEIEKIAKSKKPVFSIYCNDESRKVEGIKVVVTKEEKGSTKPQEIVLPLGQVADWLLINTLGRIPSQNGLGVEIKGTRAKVKKGAQGDKITVITVLAYDGKTTSVKKDENLIVTCEKKTGEGATRSGSLPISIPIRVKAYTGKDANRVPKLNKKGEQVYKTVRLKANCPAIPVLQRKPEYVQYFGQLRQGTHIPAKMSELEQKEAARILTEVYKMQGVPGGDTKMSAAIAKAVEASNANVQR